MMKTKRHLALIASLLCATTSNASAMRCGNKIVADGATRAEVRALCGEPEDIARHDIMQQPSYVRGGRIIYFGTEFVAVPVEVWTYNFGPNTLMRRLRFVNGLLDEIETLGYGHRLPNSQ
ncbi:MAG: DUF2845 domain-containing protein [Candidatus Obscuribacterales bacterium]|nr:DUF2845 domain-containing protein [Steroidobacteraceae bacterium]